MDHESKGVWIMKVRVNEVGGHWSYLLRITTEMSQCLSIHGTITILFYTK